MALATGQLAGRNSLRDIVGNLKAQACSPDFDGVKAIFEQLEEVTPVFITHGGRTYVVVGPAGPFGISVDDL